MSRTLHRLLGILAVAVMLWLSVTGIWMQGIDLSASASHDAAPDPTELSIIEGMYGQPAYAVVQVADFTAESLPTGMDIARSFDTVLRADQAARGSTATGSADGAAPVARVDWIELRMAGHVPIGQVLAGGTLRAYDALTGAPVTPNPPQMLPQGRRLPPSLRQRLKTLHRFWNRNDRPGVFFELLVGLVLWTFLVTGLVMYFRLLAARKRVKRPQWFWLSGGTLRGLHRSVSIAAAVLLLVMAFTGTWIGFESSWSTLWGREAAGAARRANPGTGLDPSQVPGLVGTTLSAVRATHPGIAIKVVRLRGFGTMKQAVVVDDGRPPGQWVFDATSGAPASLTEPGYPRSSFPFGVQRHEDMKHLHSGAMFGIPARVLNLLAGCSLAFLSVSGIYVYLEIWWKRRKAGRRAFLWMK